MGQITRSELQLLTFLAPPATSEIRVPRRALFTHVEGVINGRLDKPAGVGGGTADPESPYPVIDVLQLVFDGDTVFEMTGKELRNWTYWTDGVLPGRTAITPAAGVNDTFLGRFKVPVTAFRAVNPMQTAMPSDLSASEITFRVRWNNPVALLSGGAYGAGIAYGINPSLQLILEQNEDRSFAPSAINRFRRFTVPIAATGRTPFSLRQLRAVRAFLIQFTAGLGNFVEGIAQDGIVDRITLESGPGVRDIENLLVADLVEQSRRDASISDPTPAGYLFLDTVKFGRLTKMLTLDPGQDPQLIFNVAVLGPGTNRIVISTLEEFVPLGLARAQAALTGAQGAGAGRAMAAAGR